MVIPRLLKEIIEGVSSLPGVGAVLLFEPELGSALSDKADPWELTVCLEAPLALEFRRSLLVPRSTLWESDDSGFGPEDRGELNDGTRVRLVYRSLDALTDEVSQVVDGARALRTGTTDLWNKVTKSSVLFDPTGRAAATQARFSVPFPHALQRAVVQLHWPLLSDGLESFSTQAIRAFHRGDWFEGHRAAVAFLASAFELVFAVNGQPYSGGARLIERSNALPRLPSDWANLLTAVDRSLTGGRQTLPDALGRVTEALRVFLVRNEFLAPPVTRTPKGEAPVTPSPTGEGRSSAPTPLTVFTDGGCIGNPGKGAWAYLIDDGTLREEDTNGELLTTNNKMELQAVIEALTAISKKPEWKDRPIRIHTDSQYVRNGITSWIKTWSANGWKTAAKEPVKNQDLWVQLQKWDALLKPEWKWVKGHAGNPNNERCDRLVRRTMDQL